MILDVDVNDFAYPWGRQEKWSIMILTKKIDSYSEDANEIATIYSN